MTCVITHQKESRQCSHNALYQVLRQWDPVLVDFYAPFASLVAVSKGVVTRTELVPKVSILLTISGTKNMPPEALTELLT